MNIEIGKKPTQQSVIDFGIKNSKVQWNLAPSDLAKISVDKKLGIYTDTGALAIDTGEFTGRSPKDRFLSLIHI